MEVEPTLVDEPELFVREFVHLLGVVEPLVSDFRSKDDFRSCGDLLSAQVHFMLGDPPDC